MAANFNFDLGALKTILQRADGVNNRPKDGKIEIAEVIDYKELIAAGTDQAAKDDLIPKLDFMFNNFAKLGIKENGVDFLTEASLTSVAASGLDGNANAITNADLEATPIPPTTAENNVLNIAAGFNNAQVIDGQAGQDRIIVPGFGDDYNITKDVNGNYHLTSQKHNINLKMKNIEEIEFKNPVGYQAQYVDNFYKLKLEGKPVPPPNFNPPAGTADDDNLSIQPGFKSDKVMDGLAGNDTVNVSGFPQDYKITKDADGTYRLTSDKHSVDVKMKNVENIKFNNAMQTAPMAIEDYLKSQNPDPNAPKPTDVDPNITITAADAKAVIDAAAGDGKKITEAELKNFINATQNENLKNAAKVMLRDFATIAAGSADGNEPGISAADVDAIAARDGNATDIHNIDLKRAPKLPVSFDDAKKVFQDAADNFSDGSKLSREELRDYIRTVQDPKLKNVAHVLLENFDVMAKAYNDGDTRMMSLEDVFTVADAAGNTGDITQADIDETKKKQGPTAPPGTTPPGGGTTPNPGPGTEPGGGTTPPNPGPGRPPANQNIFQMLMLLIMTLLLGQNRR